MNWSPMTVGLRQTILKLHAISPCLILLFICGATNGQTTSAPTCESREWAEYCHYRINQGVLSSEWLNVLRRPRQAAGAMKGKDSEPKSDAVSLLAPTLVQYGVLAKPEELAAWVEANMQTIRDLRAVRSPVGSLPLKNGQEAFELFTDPDLTTMWIKERLLLAHAMTSDTLDELTPDLLTFDRLLKITKTGHSTIEIVSVLAQEKIKWESLLLATNDGAAKTKYGGYVRDAKAVVSAEDLGITFGECTRRYILELVSSDPNHLTGGKPFDASECSQLDREYRRFADTVAHFRTWADVEAFRASLDDQAGGRAVKEDLGEESLGASGRIIRMWFEANELREVAKALYEGGVSRAVAIHPTFVKLRALDSDSQRLEITLGKKKWIATTPR